MSDETDKPDEQNESHHIADEYRHLKDFFSKHGNKLSTLLAIVLIVTLGVRFYRNRRETTARNASARLATARSVQELEGLVEEYKSAPSAPLARIRLAKAYFEAGNYDMALSTYEQIQSRDADHPLVQVAGVGIAHCLEARGQAAEALQSFTDFLVANPDHFLAAQALFGKVRCLDQLSRTSEAKAEIEEYIAANPDSLWLAPAEELLDILKGKLASQSPDTAPAAGDTPLIDIQSLTPAPSAEQAIPERPADLP